MEQYLDEKDGKWHITFWFDMPKVIIKNKLNFRIKEIILNDNSKLSDPQLNNSKYIFPIHKSMLGKKIFFNCSFDISEISKISEFVFGLCDERVRWFNDSLVNIKNKKKIEDFFEIIKNEDIEESNEIELYSIKSTPNIKKSNYSSESLSTEVVIKNEPVIENKLQVQSSKKHVGRKSKR